MEAIKHLLSPDLVFIKDYKDKIELFNDMGNLLSSKNLVKESFTKALIEREEKFPTGFDLSIVESTKTIPNIAIPHTEVEHCNTSNVVVIKLKSPISFNNIMNPSETVLVNYIFMIINNDKNNQVGVLKNLMEFSTNVNKILELENLENPLDIYKFLTVN